MFKNFAIWLKVFISVILLLTLVPIQANADEEYVFPKVMTSSISEKIIAYKGSQNPGFTTIKFETNKPVVAYLKVYNSTASTTIELSKWLNKKSKYEFFFVPMNYEKAYYDKFEALPSGIYNVSIEITDERYNKSIVGISTIQIMEEVKKIPLVEILDIKITNEVKALKISPKMIFQYKVNRPAILEAPVFRDYINDFVGGERTQVAALPVKHGITMPGIYEVEWDLSPFFVITPDGPLPPGTKIILPTDEYKLFFRSQEESIRTYASQPTFDELINNAEIDFLVTFNKNNAQIKILDGWAPQFEDIQNHWSRNNILFLSSEKIINGVGNNKFAPNNKITRAEYMKMILLSLKINFDSKDKSKFTDVQPNEWYHDIIETASELGLVTGYVDNTFKPNNSITREEMAAIAVRALNYKTAQQPAIDENALSVLDIYNDKNNISLWAKNYIAIATNYGLLKGNTDNLFDPNGISTRAEGAAVVKRLYDYVNTSN